MAFPSSISLSSFSCSQQFTSNLSDMSLQLRLVDGPILFSSLDSASPFLPQVLATIALANSIRKKLDKLRKFYSLINQRDILRRAKARRAERRPKLEEEWLEVIARGMWSLLRLRCISSDPYMCKCRTGSGTTGGTRSGTFPLLSISNRRIPRFQVRCRLDSNRRRFQ